MEHINVLNRIIEAESNARALADEALSKREHLNESIAKECGQLREEYMKRAQERVDAELARESAQSDRIVAQLEEKLKLDLLEVDRRLAARREELAAKVFSLVVEGDG